MRVFKHLINMTIPRINTSALRRIPGEEIGRWRCCWVKEETELWTKQLLDSEMRLKHLCGHSYSVSATGSLEVQSRGSNETKEAICYGTRV